MIFKAQVPFHSRQKKIKINKIIFSAPRLLSNIETILVRATVVRDMEEAILKKVNLITRDFTSDWVEPFVRVVELILVISQVTMDIAVGQASGGPLAQGAEECRCPPGGSQYLAWADWPLILEMMNITLTAAQYSNYDLNQKPSCLQVTAASLASSVPPGITGIYGTGGEFQDVFFSNQNWHFSPCQFWKEDAFLILAFLSNQDTRIYKMIQYHCYRMSQLKSVFGYQWLFLCFWKYKYKTKTALQSPESAAATFSRLNIAIRSRSWRWQNC